MYSPRFRVQIMTFCFQEIKPVIDSRNELLRMALVGKARTGIILKGLLVDQR
jgi:hypothetical protein